MLAPLGAPSDLRENIPFSLVVLEEAMETHGDKWLDLTLS